MKRHSENKKSGPVGPSQRQLRAGELVRHALVEILREHEISHSALVGVSVTITEVRMTPDLRNALCFVEPLGGDRANEVDTGNQWAGAHHARAARKREAILVVNSGPLDVDGDIALAEFGIRQVVAHRNGDGAALGPRDLQRPCHTHPP